MKKKREIKTHPAGEYWFSYYILLKMHFQHEMTKSALMHWLYVCLCGVRGKRKTVIFSLAIDRLSEWLGIHIHFRFCQRLQWHAHIICLSANAILQASDVGRKWVSPTSSKSLCSFAPFGMFKINHCKQNFHCGIFPSNYSTTDSHLTYYLSIFAATTIYNFRG